VNRSAASAPAKPGVDLLLMWHMHQPDYRDLATGDFSMPWVYLHAVKDYADMAWHLERNPGLRAVVNFVPVLLDQIEDYCEQFAGGRLRDPLLRLLARDEHTPLSDAEREHAFGQCFRADHHRLIAPFPPYQHLYQLFQAMEAQGAHSIAYLSDSYIRDLVTWYHLSWTGETVRRESEVIARLMAQGTAFTLEDRLGLLRVYGEIVRQIIPRYRALAQRGQVELTSTPHCHPLSPLLLDFRCARDALPDAPLPQTDHYPGGGERVCAHLDSALASHARRFGAPPQGIWPAEGALSGSFAALLAQRGVRWTASGEGVLGNSLRLGGAAPPASPVPAQDAAAKAADGAAPALAEYHVHQPYRAPGVAPGLLFFFRDDRLSDLIGFVYSKWHGRDAAENFIHELEAIGAKFAGRPRPLVSVILDGENAWEYYPYNAFFFFSDLYRNLSQHESIRTVTGSDIVAELAAPNAQQRGIVRETHQIDAAAATRPVGELTALAAGSWVYGNLATWIGSRDKNHAWDLLCAAKQRYDEVLAAGLLDAEQRALALAQLADCEASDWFWWPGDDNPSESVLAFEALFRAKLSNLYRLLQSPPPAALGAVFSAGSGSGPSRAEAGGTMRRGTA
jgi:alpha-amylase/alpha-mannosidase (GH57 family)